MRARLQCVHVTSVRDLCIIYVRVRDLCTIYVEKSRVLHARALAMRV